MPSGAVRGLTALHVSPRGLVAAPPRPRAGSVGDRGRDVPALRSPGLARGGESPALPLPLVPLREAVRPPVLPLERDQLSLRRCASGSDASLLSVVFSICRTHSRVTPKVRPTSSRVRG